MNNAQRIFFLSHVVFSCLFIFQSHFSKSKSSHPKKIKPRLIRNKKKKVSVGEKAVAPISKLQKALK